MAQELRCNQRIRVTPIRLIDADGTQVGIVDTRDAQVRAREAGLDLVEVAPQARPPVCRIMDYGKWKYAQKKKERKAKAHRHEVELKEIRIRTAKIGSHDLGIKVGRAREFLERGDRVRFTLRFRGRENLHRELGREILNGVKGLLSEVSKVEQDMHQEGRAINMILMSTVKSKQPRQAEAAPADVGKPAGEKPAPAAAPAPQSTRPQAPTAPASPTA